MTQHPPTRPYRSVLYVPGDKPRALEKARGLDADAFILDLEDAVLPAHKAQARQAVVGALRQGGYAAPLLVRIGSGRDETPDFEAVLGAAPAGIVLPKAESPAQVAELHLGVPLWLMIETPLGIVNLPQLAAVPGVAGLIVGANDLALGLRARPGPGRAALLPHLSAVVLHARARGLVALDAVYNNVHDAAGFEASCEQGRDLGFDGRTVIHPDQIAAANRQYGVSAAEVQQARAVLAAWDGAVAAGLSVTTLRGQLIEELHAREAQAVVRRWEREQA